MPASSWRLLWRNALPQYGVTFGQYLVPLLTLPYLTRVLGAEVYGLVVLLTAFTSYFQLLVEFGFNLSAATHVAVRRDDLSDVARIRSEVFRGRLLLAVSAALLFASVMLLSDFMRGFELLAIAYFLSAVLTGFIPIFLFRGMEMMSSLSAILVGSRLLFAMLIFVLVRTSDDVMWVPLANSLGSAVVIGFAAWHMKWKLRLPRRPASSREVKVSFLASVPYFIDAIASTAFGALTVVVLSVAELSLEELALWGASYQLIAAAQSMYVPVVASLLPRMARLLDWGLVRSLMLRLGPVVLVGCVALFTGGDFVMEFLYGAEFAEGGAVFRALVPVLAISFPALLLGSPVLGAVGRQTLIARSTLVAGACFIMALAGLWMLGSLELVLVAALRSVSEALLFVIRLWHVGAYRRSSQS